MEILFLTDIVLKFERAEMQIIRWDVWRFHERRERMLLPFLISRAPLLEMRGQVYNSCV